MYILFIYHDADDMTYGDAVANDINECCDQELHKSPRQYFFVKHSVPFRQSASTFISVLDQFQFCVEMSFVVALQASQVSHLDNLQ